MIPPEGKGGIFGFAEFVQAFALLVLIFTVTGVRYQFRIATAPVRLWRLTYFASALIGFSALLTDLWFAQRYPIPWFLSTSQAFWQVGMGASFLALALAWLWFAYVQPPKYGRASSLRFTQAVYRYVMQGADSDLPVVADELERSAESIVAFASASFEQKHIIKRAQGSAPEAEDYACDLLLIIANRRFCRHVASYAPNTAIKLFRAVAKTKQYSIPMSQFSSSVATEAILNTDSLLYHEDSGYFSGYFGYERPFTNAIFGNFRFVEALASNGKSPLDIDLEVRWKINGKQLEVYTRCALTTLKAALAAGAFHENSYALNRAFEIIKYACADLYKLNEPIAPQDRADIIARLHAVVGFVNDAIDALQIEGVQITRIRSHGEAYRWQEDYYDRIAFLVFEVIGHAAALKIKGHNSWSIHYGAIWARLSNFDQSATRKIVLFKVRRLLYEEVKGIEKSPNFLNASYLGYLLNVLGVKEEGRRTFRRFDYPLSKAVIALARRNYLKLVKRYPKLAEAVLIGTISFDAEKKQLVKTYIEGLELVAPTDTLDLLDPD